MAGKNTSEFTATQDFDASETSANDAPEPVREVLNSGFENEVAQWRQGKAEREQTTYQLNQELKGDGPLAQFAQKALKGELDRETIDLAVHGGNAAFQLQDNGKPLDEQLREHGKRLEQEYRTFWRNGLDRTEWNRDAEDPKATGYAAKNAVFENGLNHVLEASPNYPPEHMEHPNSHVNQVWEKKWESNMTSFGRRDWEMVSVALEMRNQEAVKFRETDEPPKWLNPDAFPPEAFEISPELKQLGYSEMHNTPIDVYDRPENIEKYLRRQMDAHVSGPGKVNMEENPAAFGKALLEPELDPELGANWTRLDPGAFYYTDDGPINYEEEHHIRLLLEGDTTDPKNHLEISYGRMVRDALMYKGMADDPYMNRADLLSISYPRNVLALRRMSDLAHQITEGYEGGEWERPAMDGYEPAVVWNRDSQENLERVIDLTENLTDMNKLKSAIQDSFAALEAHFDPQDRIDHESATKIYSFMPQPADPGDRDLDHPSAILLREGIYDTSQAAQFADLARYDEILAVAWQASQDGMLEEKMEQLKEERITWQVIGKVSQAVQLMDTRENNSRMWGMPHQNDQILEKLRPDQADMIHRAIDRMAHADFCMTMAKANADKSN